MKIRVDSASGAEVVEVDFSTMEDDRLDAFAAAGSADAQEELRKRTGINPYKPLSEVTAADLAHYEEWQKNKQSEKYNTIDKSDSDVE